MFFRIVTPYLVVAVHPCIKWIQIKKIYIFCLAFLDAPQGSISCPLFSLIYINSWSNHLVSTVKQFTTNDTLIFIIHNAKTLAGELNSDLKAISEWSSICHLIEIWIRLKLYFQGKWQNHITHKSVSTLSEEKFI